MNARRIKVAYVLTPISFGGSEKVSLNFLRHADRNRFDIMPILLLRPWEEVPYFAREIGKLGYTYTTLPVSLRKGGDPVRVMRVAWRLLHILRRERFDLVHTHGYFADICTVFCSRLLGVPAVATCHGFIGNDSKLRLYNALDRSTIKRCSRVIAVSDTIRIQLTANGVAPAKIVLISNAVAAQEGEGAENAQTVRGTFGITADDMVIGYLGRLSEEKGLRFLLQAASRLRREGLQVKLLLVGEGPEREVLERMAREEDSDFVVFAGFQTDIGRWLRIFDVFVLPSLTEGTPLALLEAMAAGVPIVATAVGGVPAIISDGVNGKLVPPADVVALGEGVRQILVDSELQERFRDAGKNTIRQKYCIEQWCRSIENIYLETLSSST